MRWITALFVTGACAFAQESFRRIHALERPGVAHVEVRGRVVNDAGEPLRDVRLMLKSGNTRSLPLMETRTGADGRFTFRDVRATSGIGVLIDPPPRYAPGGAVIEAVSGTKVDIGDLKVERSRVLRVTVELLGPGRSEIAPADMRVFWKSDSTGVIPARREGEDFLMEHLPNEPGTLQMEIYKLNAEFFQPLAFRWSEKTIRLQLLADTARLQAGRHLRQAELQVLARAEEDFRPPRIPTLTGRVTTPDGEPLGGAVVQLDQTFRPSKSFQVVTGADGSFGLPFHAEHCQTPRVAFVGVHWKSGPSGADCDLERFVGEPLEIIVESALPLELTAQSETGPLDNVHYSWRDGGIFGAAQDAEWRILESSSTWTARWSVSTTATLRAETEGRIPVVTTLQLPGTNRKQSDPPTPERLEVAFHFESGGSYELTATDGSSPIPDAAVDIERIEDLASGRAAFLGTFRTDASGALNLRGPKEGRYLLYVYADGYEPQRVIWMPGRPATVILRRNDAVIRVTGLPEGGRARVKPAGGYLTLAAGLASGGRPVELRIPAGAYDVVLTGANGRPMSLARRTVASRDILELSTTELADQRPTVRVTFANPGQWGAGATRSTPAGAAAGWAMMSTLGGQLSLAEPAAEVVERTPTRVVLRMAGTGEFQVICGRRDLESQLSRTVRLEPGDDIEVAVPRLRSAFAGSMKTYDGGVGFSHHGWAGPRLMLRPAAEDGWAATVNLPRRTTGDAFEMRALPEGDYWLFQHLIGEPASYKRPDGQEIPYTRPVYVYGGIPVKLVADEMTQLADFAEFAGGELRLEILDAGGRPMEGSIRVRDRMAEAWAQVAGGGTTLANADHPIPPGPAARLVRGVATVPRIRKGYLEMTFVTDDGRVYEISRQVDPAEALRIRLD